MKKASKTKPIKPDPKFEKRKDVVAAVLRGEAVIVVARIYHIPKRTVFDWLAKYRQGGWGNLQTNKRSGRPRRVTGEVMQNLYEKITLGDPRQFKLPFCLWTLNIVRVVLKNEYGITLSKSSVSRLLNHMGLSPQRPIHRSYKQDPCKMENYLQKTFPELKALAKQTGASIFFIDESSARSDHHRGTTWGAVGQTPVVEDSGGRFGVKLISAVNARGLMYFETIEERMNSEKFINFLERLRADVGTPIIAIVDNATYHRSKKVKEYIAENKVVLEYLPPYAPELNPDEQVWNHAKARLSKLFIDSKKTMQDSLQNIMNDIQRNTKLIQSFFGLKTTRYAAE